MFAPPCQEAAGRARSDYEIKHDGFRILAERDAKGVTLQTRRGYNFADRFPLAAAAVAQLPVRSCLIHGEAIVCDGNGLAVFDLLRRCWHGDHVILCAFDLLEPRRRAFAPAALKARKRALARLLRGAETGTARRDRLPARLLARLRGHRVEAPGLAVPLGACRIAG